LDFGIHAFDEGFYLGDEPAFFLEKSGQMPEDQIQYSLEEARIANGCDITDTNQPHITR
jgi:hypothetical protein